MKLDPIGWEKANDDLRRFLESTDADTPVRVVLILDVDGRENATQRPETRPSDYASAFEYRNALIERRKYEVSKSTSDTVEALRHLSLQIFGSEIGRALVAEGSAARIADALKLQGVSSAILDRPIDLVRPVTSKDL